MEKALVLARELVSAERINTQESLTHKLEQMNNLQRKLDKNDERYATKGELRASNLVIDKEIKSLSRMVYIGLGALLAIQFIIRYLK